MLIGLPGRQRRLEEADHAAEEGRSGSIIAVAGDAPLIHRSLHDQNLLVGVAVVLLMGRV